MSIAIQWRRPRPGRPDLDAGSHRRSIAGDFADRVRARSGLASHKEAERLTRVTLQCLLARLSRRLQQERYFEQIAHEVELELAVARRRAMAVGTVLAECLPEVVLSDIAGEVPRIFQALVPQRAGLAHPAPAGRLGSDAVIPLFMAPASTPSYLGLAWHCSSQKL